MLNAYNHQSKARILSKTILLFVRARRTGGVPDVLPDKPGHFGLWKLGRNRQGVETFGEYPI